MDGESPSMTVYLPLAFALVPAIGGIVFGSTSHSDILTDAMLIILSGFYLKYLIAWPREWYHITRHQHTNSESSQLLRQDAIYALCASFLGPLVGALLLHWVRQTLARPRDAAELKPASHLLDMINHRSINLRRSLNELPPSEIEQRITELKRLVTEHLTKPDPSEKTNMDALNRAVRRYEKKQYLTNALLDEKITLLERKVNELSALCATTYKQPPAVIVLFGWIRNVVYIPLLLVWSVVALPSKAVGYITRKDDVRKLLN